MESKLVGIVVALLIGGGLFWMKFNDKNNDEQDLRNIAYAVLETAPGFDDHESDYEYYFELFHDETFERHYRMGGRRTSASFDEDAYWTELLAEMIRSASADGKAEVATGLTELRDNLFRID